MDPDAARILSFWLDEVGPEGWYKQSDDLDGRIKAEFEDLWQQGNEGRLDTWLASAPSCLALLVLLDQFSRNMFRGTAGAFSSDRQALLRAKLAIGQRFDLNIKEPERQFFYLPLMHAETLADQEWCVRMILLRMPECGKDNIEHAIKHRAVIRRFGRFPSRNAALGRQDSDAEKAYRAEGGYMS